MAQKPSKGMEEMSMNNEEPPSQYIVKGCSFAPLDISSSHSSSQFPVIDINLFSQFSSPSNEVDTILETLRSALGLIDCFQVHIVLIILIYHLFLFKNLFSYPNSID